MEKNHVRGFSLIEVAIVLAVIGVVVGMGMPIFNKYNTHTKIMLTKERMEKVTYALAGFVLMHGNLPRPSADEIIGIVDKNTTHGYLPFQTLGLDESVSKDGFGKRFMYVVEPQMYADFATPLLVGAANKYQENYCRNQDVKTLNLHLIKPSGQVVRPTFANDFVGFILISTGASTPPLSPDEEMNINRSVDYIQRPFNPTGFRQIVKWETRNNLIAAYGHAPCDPLHISDPNRQAHMDRNQAADGPDEIEFPEITPPFPADAGPVLPPRDSDPAPTGDTD